MAVLCRIRTPEAYKEANEFFADEFLFQKKCIYIYIISVNKIYCKVEKKKCLSRLSRMMSL